MGLFGMNERVIFNFVPVSAGGGLQNALSFLSFLRGRSGLSFDFIVVCRSGSKIQEYCGKYDIPHVVIKDFFVSRLFFEIIGGALLAKRVRADLVFSLFGGSPFLMYGVAKKVCGFAYSNIIETNIDFWWFCGRRKKILRKLVDFFRLRSAKNADCVILETDRLARLAKEGVFKNREIAVVHMAPSSLIDHKPVDRVRAIGKKGSFSILYLCGAHKNKRIKNLAPIFQCLHNEGRNVFLVTTLPADSSVYLEVREAFEKLGVANALKNIGPVSPDSLNELFDNVDGVVNVALLESFSNNWVEAWAASLPLFVTDAGWARDSCADAAVYIDIENPRCAANRIYETFSSIDRMESVVSSGKEMLRVLPSPETKFHNYKQIIEKHLKERA